MFGNGQSAPPAPDPEETLLTAIVQRALKDARAGVPSNTRTEARRWLAEDAPALALAAGWNDLAPALERLTWQPSPEEIAARFGVSLVGAQFAQSEAMQAEAAHRARADRLGVMPQYLSREE